jgi:hypothetical protein
LNTYTLATANCYESRVKETLYIRRIHPIIGSVPCIELTSNTVADVDIKNLTQGQFVVSESMNLDHCDN